MGGKKGEVIGIVPAAGSGTRLFPYNGAKEVLPIGSQSMEINGKREDRPKIVSQYVIEAMIEAGVNKIIVIINEYKGNLIRLFGNGSNYGIDICYIFQDRPMGMAHAINLAKGWIEGATILLGMPDTVVLPQTCFKQLLQKHQAAEAELSLGLFPTDKPYKFGMVDIDKENNITHHVDKPKESSLKTMWGIACWEEGFTKKISQNIEALMGSDKEVVLGDLFDLMLKEKRTCKGYPIEGGEYFDIGTYDDFKRAVSILN